VLSQKINDLRKLHSTFGHLFCGEVTLGGTLFTSKVVEGKEEKTFSSASEKFKAEVGAALSTVIS
jgi:hypothetical protein